ncbi:uncharacterized protein LOC142242533 [Haematobia irritans]|uniref:uncharacterized protein LOC142242533 n=1 Tax=Haematobia irritans TaxID=7368 RepID=UPI003F4F930E
MMILTALAYSTTTLNKATKVVSLRLFELWPPPAIERFIRANDKLINFEQQLTDSVITDSSIFALEVHRDELKAIWIAIKSLYEKCVDHFDKQETKLADDGREDDSDSDSATGNTDLDSINSRYHASYDTYVRIVSKLNSNIHERGRLPSIAPHNVPTSNFHLPACDTESFRGDYQSWPSFRDMFSAVYVKNSSLSKVQKLFHLRKKTEGEAHEIVKKCPLTNSGFDIAWANLTDRFENKRMLVHSQLRVLLNLATITSESSEGIKGLQRDINSCISCLKLYDVDVSTWDAIFVYICSSKLPRTSLSLWEQSIKNKKDVSKWSELDSFLSSRYQTLETISEISGVSTPNLPHSNCNAKKQNNSSTRKVHSNLAKVSSSQNNPTCNLCIGESHPIRKCPKFLQMNVNDRMSCIKRLNLCINCFAKSHNVKKCKSPYSCFSCHRRHNSLLHNNTLTPVSIDSTPTIHSQVNEELQDPQIQSTSSIDPPGFPLSSEGRIQSCFASHSQNVLLGTALVQITHLGMRYIVRALIDSGSQTFLSERIFQLLKLPFRPVEAEISGLNGVTSANARKLVNLTVCPRFESDVELNITALVVPQLSGNLPTSPINSSILQQLPGIQLADPMFYQFGRVDMLIGADLFNNILLENVKKNICGSLVAQETVFGWIITGPVVSQSTISSFSTMVSFVTECTLEKQLRRFWEVEDVPQQPMLSQADSFCEALYTETTTRDEDGRYIVALPFRPEFLEGYRILGDSRALAERQFLRNEARLLKNVEQKSNNYEIYKWTDSSIVLSWLRKPACHWKVFVANRVSTITNKVGIDNWSHVASKFNPADLASRGVCPQDLLDNQLWWHGPPWLEQPPELWPGQGYEPEETNLEQKSVRVHLAVCSDKVDILERFSCYSRAIKVLCYAFRFYQRTHPTHREHFKYRSTCLTSVEFSRMRNKLIVLAQENFFPETVNALSKHENIPKSSSILNLNPFLDDNGVIRASGRLAFAPSLSYDERFPIIMPYNCQFSRLLVKFVHHLCLHGGNQQVINLVRLQFLIPKLRNLVKSTIHQCKKCVLHKKKIQQQLMAALPPERTTLRRPFHSTGIDFAGPFEIRSFAGRGYKINKGYVCVFICFATKAIHLEATSSLSTAAFLAAFQRFVSRRGCPLNVYSDNGTNFIGASKEIAHDFLSSSKSSLLSQFAPQQLSWHFIPPGAPHMGGLWEAGVKSFKTHLKKVSGSFNFTFEEFCTLLSKIEACLNSRPISTISDDPADLNPLTPGHFLTGGPILAPPEPTYDNDPESVVNRWQRVKVLHQNF